jgi:hypothetical protein
MPASTSGYPVRPSHQRSKRPRARLHESVAREVQQHVMVEIAPAELAAKRLGAGAAGQAPLDLTRREAAEVQVRREARGRVLAELVASLPVAADVVREKARQPLARRALAPGGRVRDLLLQAERPERRDAPLGHARRQGRQLARSVEHLAPAFALPRAMERREDRVRLAGLRARRAELVDRAEPGMREELDAAPVQRSAHARAARPRERRHVAGEVKRSRPRPARELGQLALGRALAQQQPAAPLAQRAVELGQALEQELRARP